MKFPGIKSTLSPEVRKDGQADVVDLYTANLADAMQIERAAHARGYGFDPLPARQGPAVARTYNTTTTTDAQGGLMKGALLAACLGSGGLLGGAGLLSLASHQQPAPQPAPIVLTQPAQAAVTPQSAVPTQPVAQPRQELQPQEYDITIEVKDGKLLPTEVTPVTK